MKFSYWVIQIPPIILFCKDIIAQNLGYVNRLCPLFTICLQLWDKTHGQNWTKLVMSTLCPQLCPTGGRKNLRDKTWTKPRHNLDIDIDIDNDIDNILFPKENNISGVMSTGKLGGREGSGRGINASYISCVWEKQRQEVAFWDRREIRFDSDGVRLPSSYLPVLLMFGAVYCSSTNNFLYKGIWYADRGGGFLGGLKVPPPSRGKKNGKGRGFPWWIET